MSLRTPFARLVAATALLGAGGATLQAQTAPVHLTPVATIGCGMCGGPEEFGAVMAVAVGPDGVAVADRDAPHVRVFGTDGGLRWVAGPEGDGPGELRLPSALTLGPAGVAVVDMRGAHLVRLGPDGGERDRIRLGGFPLAASFAPESEALDVSLADFRAMRATVARWEGQGGWRTLHDGLDELALRPPGEPPLYFSLARAGDGGFAIGIGVETYRVLWFDARGAPVREVTRDVPRTPRSDAEMEEERARRSAAAARLGAAEGGRSSSPEVDRYRLHFRMDALRFDEVGRLWVRTDRAPEGTVFDVFDRHGGFLGEVRVDARVDAFDVGHGHLVGVVPGAFDVASVRLWRVGSGSP